MIMASDETDARPGLSLVPSAPEPETAPVPRSIRTSDLLIADFVKPVEDEAGALLEMRYENADRYNFAFERMESISSLSFSSEQSDRYFSSIGSFSLSRTIFMPR